MPYFECPQCRHTQAYYGFLERVVCQQCSVVRVGYTGYDFYND